MDQVKHALISGGGSGIGRLHALRLVERGAKVTILDVNEKGPAEVAGRSPNVLAIRCDVTKLDEVRAAITRAEQQNGTIDRLINCAAIMPGGLLKDASPESLSTIKQINYGGMINVCQTSCRRCSSATRATSSSTVRLRASCQRSVSAATARRRPRTTSTPKS